VRTLALRARGLLSSAVTHFQEHGLAP